MRREAGLLLLVAFGLRILAMFVLDTPHAASQSWQWESGALAAALARGDGLANPFEGFHGAVTGPSAWLTPVYPGLLAAALVLFGGATTGATVFVFVIQALVSAFTCVALRPIGALASLPRVGRLAAWFLALNPLSVWFAVGRLWDSTLVAGSFALFLLLLLRAGPSPGKGRAAFLGAVFGGVLLVGPAPIGVLPVVLLYIGKGGLRSALPRWAAFGAAALAVCAPWMARNQFALGTLGLRSNLGVELRVGNNDDADGRFQTQVHPADPRNTPRYVELGEVAYSAESRELALEWIRADYGRFAKLCLLRLKLFWFGENPRDDSRKSGTFTAGDDPKAWVKWVSSFTTGALALLALVVWRPRMREGLLIAGILLFYPCPYYVTHVTERYRLPVDPLIVFLDAWLVLRIVDRVRKSRGGPA